MTQRLKYTEVAPYGIAAMRALEHYCNAETLLDPVLLELVRLRASHLNGCGYCIDMHSHELAKHNDTPERIARTADPEGFDGFTHRELAALAWTDAVTNIQSGHASDEAYAAVREHFDEHDVVNLTLAIASINSWNRMAIAFRAERSSPVQAEHAPQQPTTAKADQQPAPEIQPHEADASAVGDDGGKVAVDE